MEWQRPDILALAVLAAGVADDLLTRKIHNALVFPALILCFLAAGFERGWLQPLTSVGLTLVIGLLLFKFKVWGGGDAKLLIAVSPLLIFVEVPIYILWCFIWGAALGLIQAALNGRLTSMANNLGVMLAHRKAVEEKHLVKVPFSVALFFGYLALVTLRSLEGLP